MNLRSFSLAAAPVALALALAPVAGCGAKYSSSCKKSDLTPPFTELGLPADQGRVCDSDDKKARLEFVGKDKAKWRDAVEASVTAAGFAKESCPSYCVYTKGTQRLQVIVGDISDKWVTVSLIMSAGRDKGGSSSPTTRASDERAAAPSAGRSVDSIPECKSYFAKLLACPPAKGPLSHQEEADLKRRELQKKLDEGRSSTPGIVASTCERFERSLRCR